MLMFLSVRRPSCCCFFSSPPQSQHSKPPNFAITDYLISSFGFSADKADKLSKPLSHLKSPQNLDSVRRFFQQEGFSSDADIRKLVTLRPKILCSSPDKTLAPNLTALRNVGLSTTALTHLILTTPAAIMFCSAASTVKFWLDFFGGDETALLKAIHHDSGLITSAITRVVGNISVLRTRGLSTDDIRLVVLRVPRFINTGTALFEDTVNRVEELGLQHGSIKFAQGLHAMHHNSKEGLHNKIELFGRFGWSEDSFLMALRKAPSWATLSEKTLQAKMDFFVGEAGCDPSYIASHPMLLAYSLEKRLRPRLRVLHLLESRGYCDEKRGFYNKICWGNKEFVETYVYSHKEEIPELLEAYHAACAS